VVTTQVVYGVGHAILEYVSCMLRNGIMYVDTYIVRGTGIQATYTHLYQCT